jgi:hypothetical protein
MDKIRNIAKVVQDYWLFITIAATAFGGLIKIVHEYYMVPVVIDPLVRNISYRLYSDSSDVWRDRWVSQMPGGHGSRMATAFDMSKDSIPIVLAQLWEDEQEKEMSITYLMDMIQYQVNFNTTIFLMATDPYNHKGINMRRTKPHPDNDRYDVYYMDGFNKWWKAIYYADEDAYYFIPDYTNGQRVKCD